MRNHTADATGAAQLHLLRDDRRPHDWSLDERTRRIGRQGVAAAREILRRSERDRRKAS